MEQESSAVPTRADAPSAARRIDPGQGAADDHAELRALRVESKDLRFERDRYRASAADYQEKLIASLDTLEQARSLRDEVEQARLDLVELAREYKVRETFLRGDAEQLRGELVALAAEFAQRLAQDGVSARAAFEQRHGDTVAALASEQEEALRGEVIALVNEFRIKLAEQLASRKNSRWWR